MPRRRGRASAKPEPAPVKRFCGTMAVHERLMRTVTGYREIRNLSENNALRAAMFPQTVRTGCTKILVVVHVVYNTPAQNISDAQIYSQMDVLTADFRNRNADSSSVPAVFAPLVADARIEFALATIDPNGNVTNGITRTRTQTTGFTDDDAVKSVATGGADPWPSDKYLNIWVCPMAGSLIGYAQFPGGPAATDGVVIRHTAFGTNGTAIAPFNLGRTATHEVGHWLNLHHIWGDDGTGCAGDDFVADTPNQGSENYGTPTFPHVSCNNGPNGDMFMNYMDYVDDVSMCMFTAGQVTRMQATLDGLRSAIGTSISCGKELNKEEPKDLTKEPPNENPKDLSKEYYTKESFNKDNPKEFTKDVWNKEFGKDIKEPNKEFTKENIKDNWNKEIPKDLTKDKDGKENPKDNFKEPGNDLNKIPGKDVGKDIKKEPSKDTTKEFTKDPSNELNKYPGKDVGKDSIDKDNKEFTEGQKNFADTNINFSGGLNTQPPTGGVPFAPSTGAPGVQGNRVAQQQVSALANGYLQLLSQYARLGAANQLDAAGLAAWQEATAIYQQLIALTGQL